MTTRKEKARRKQLQEEAASPDECHCRDALRSKDDEIVDYTEPIHDFYDHLRERPPHKYPIRICSACGKQYVDAPIIA